VNDETQGTAAPLRQYLTVIRRRKWWLVGAIIVCVGLATAWSLNTTPLYAATVKLTYQPQADVSSAVMGTSSYQSSYDIAQVLETYATLMTSEDMRARTVMELGLPPGAPLGASVTAQAITNTSILSIQAVSTSPSVAQRVARAYAAAFMKWRLDVAVQEYKNAQLKIELRLKDYTPAKVKADYQGYIALTSRLQDLKVLESSATGNFAMGADAQLPAAPFTPKTKRNIAFGFLTGILVGLIIAAIIEQLDVRVREQREISARLRLPIIGRLPQLAKSIVRSHDLVVLADPSGGSAEAFRMLRGNLDFLGVDANIKSILVTSCEQSEGKTSTVCNLAVTLARAGKRVVVVEADLRRPKVNAYFGLSGDSGLSSVVSGQASAAAALQTIAIDLPGVEPGGNGDSPQVRPVGVGQLSVLTSGPLPPNPGEIVTSARIKTLIDELAAQFDYVLVDSPPFLAVGDAAALASKVDGVIVILKMGDVTKSMLRDTAEFLEPLPCRKLGVVLTHLTTEGGPYSYHYYREYGAKRASSAVK
jgi:Mrp family chromosome partitioning ATPase/capsular polysaccharide biosynthesis protein